MLLTHQVSKQVAGEAEADHERAVKQWEYQVEYLHKWDEFNATHMEQFFRDQEELRRITAEENRL